MTAILSIPSILQKSLFLDLFEEDIITGSSLAVLRTPPEDVKKIGDWEITGAGVSMWRDTECGTPEEMSPDR